jgi:phosphatidylserine/phosphatidylglycerophosphate/cardiolipin synthase-like enzyme
VQYYTWAADATGRLLAERLIEAADRGVRIRVLVDDINLAGRDADVAALQAELVSIRDRFIWAPGQIVWDDPAAIEEGITEGRMVQALFNKLQTLKSELLVESAYFVVQEKAVENVKKLAALHTKAIVFDRESVFIGSFNLDPRSGSINTEAGLYVESPELARQVIEYMDEGVRPENSYRVLLDDEGDLYWSRSSMVGRCDSTGNRERLSDSASGQVSS